MKTTNIIAALMIFIINTSCSTQRSTTNSHTSRTDTQISHLDSLVSRIFATSSTDIDIKVWPTSEEMAVFLRKWAYNQLSFVGGTMAHIDGENAADAKNQNIATSTNINSNDSGLNNPIWPIDLNPTSGEHPIIEISIHHRDTTITEHHQVSKADSISHEEQQSKSKTKRKVGVMTPAHVFAALIAIALALLIYWRATRPKQ